MRDDHAPGVRDLHDLGEHPRNQGVDEYRDDHRRLEDRLAAYDRRQHSLERAEQEVREAIGEAAERSLRIGPQHLEKQADKQKAVNDPEYEVDDLERPL